jgi:hypothetical protein
MLRRDGISFGREQESVPAWTSHSRSTGLEKFPGTLANPYGQHQTAETLVASLSLIIPGPAKREGSRSNKPPERRSSSNCRSTDPGNRRDAAELKAR